MSPRRARRTTDDGRSRETEQAVDVGRAVRLARQRAGLSQAQLARLAETSQGAVADYERGRKVPSFETFRRLLGAVGSVVVVRHADGDEFEFDQSLDDPDVRVLWQRRSEVVACAAAYGATNLHLGLPARGRAADDEVDLFAELPFRHSLDDLRAFESSLERLLSLRVTVHVLGDMTDRQRAARLARARRI
ncbi:MAG: helix-turn-helix transcriptional regulator [Actinomycetota bacterium]|nr:helix-turn-helix transcriptional regulator [Actinomycetota bacterium]